MFLPLLVLVLIPQLIFFLPQFLSFVFPNEVDVFLPLLISIPQLDVVVLARLLRLVYEVKNSNIQQKFAYNERNCNTFSPLLSSGLFQIFLLSCSNYSAEGPFYFIRFFELFGIVRFIILLRMRSDVIVLFPRMSLI